MTYFVIGPNGAQYGPADLATLQQWARDGRILPQTELRDAMTGQSVRAAQLPSLVFAPPPYSAQPHYSAYPRAGFYDPISQSDVTTAWICAVFGLLCCGPISVIGIVFANKAIAKGNDGGRAPQIVAYVALALWILMFFFRILVFGSGL